ncbi:hypothetical protein [Bacillus weihaiensis]|nr:hypothetical protein [Bacillus weihaiensis]
MELRANEHIFLEEFELNKNTAIWTEISEEKEITYTYKYYDMDGSLIENN